MSYRNSVKLLTANFNVVWKQLLYMLVICLLSFSITYAIALPIIHTLDAEGVFSQFSQVFSNIYTKPGEVFSALSAATSNLFDVIHANFSSLAVSLIFSMLFIFVVYQLLKGISYYNLSSLMYMKLTSNTTIGYTRNLIANLWPSLRFAFTRLVMKIPFALIKGLTLLAFFRIVSSPLSIILGLFIVSLVLVLLYALEISICAGHAAKYLSQGSTGSSFKAFFAGSLPILKRFAKVFSTAIMVVLTILFVNILLGIFTIGVALLITIPASQVFLSLFELTSYFGCTKERYYLSNTVIAIPRDGENKQIEQ